MRRCPTYLSTHSSPHGRRASARASPTAHGLAAAGLEQPGCLGRYVRGSLSLAPLTRTPTPHAGPHDRRQSAVLVPKCPTQSAGSPTVRGWASGPRGRAGRRSGHGHSHRVSRRFSRASVVHSVVCPQGSAADRRPWTVDHRKKEGWGRGRGRGSTPAWASNNLPPPPWSTCAGGKGTASFALDRP